MTQIELRNILVKALYDYLGGPKVVLSDQVMPEAEYPYLYYQSIQQHIPGPHNISVTATDDTIVKHRSEHAQATYSFTACSVNRAGPDGRRISGDDEAMDLADKAQGFFLYTGKPLLAALGVVVVGVENTQGRSAFGIDETDRRYGFDILLRYERKDTGETPTIAEPPVIYRKEE